MYQSSSQCAPVGLLVHLANEQHNFTWNSLIFHPSGLKALKPLALTVRTCHQLSLWVPIFIISISSPSSLVMSSTVPSGLERIAKHASVLFDGLLAVFMRGREGSVVWS